jgi:hypothetical protein
MQLLVSFRFRGVILQMQHCFRGDFAPLASQAPQIAGLPQPDAEKTPDSARCNWSLTPPSSLSGD